MLNFLSLSAFFFISMSAAEANTCKSHDNDPLFNELLNEFKKSNIDCTGVKTHLTFDDGPNEKTTGIILKELDKRNIKATFFVTTTNLTPNRPGLSERQALLKRQLQNGHTVASHGHEHNAYDLRLSNQPEAGYNAREREIQINESVSLLNKATNGQFSKQEYKLFRFPYGRGAMPSQKEIEEMERTKKMVFKGATYSEKLREYRRMSPALQQIAQHDFSHVGWNHDSNDSSLPFKMPNANIFKRYVKSNIEELCSPAKTVKTKVSLFHDIKEINTKAIPLIADLGQCLGIKFIGPKEMMNSALLTNTEIVLKNKQINKAPVEMVDELEKLIKTVNAPARNCPESATKANNSASASSTPNGCYSTYLKKTFGNCEGETSKCFEGRWYGASDPMILLNCM